jgi:cytoskeletal protein CcmA (bactofilin family)
MFRRGKDGDTPSEKPQDPAGELSAPPLKLFSHRGIHVAPKGVAETPPTEPPPARPGADLVGRRIVRPRATAGGGEGNKLTVGRDIQLKGEITACDKLVVEGHVEAALTDARVIEVAPSGYFKGDARVDEADISGRFEGTLVARDRLVVRSKGRITGEIRYGNIVIESGGEISGEMQALGPSDAKSSEKPTPDVSSPVNE